MTIRKLIGRKEPWTIYEDERPAVERDWVVPTLTFTFAVAVTPWIILWDVVGKAIF